MSPLQYFPFMFLISPRNARQSDNNIYCIYKGNTLNHDVLTSFPSIPVEPGLPSAPLLPWKKDQTQQNLIHDISQEPELSCMQLFQTFLSTVPCGMQLRLLFGSGVWFVLHHLSFRHPITEIAQQGLPYCTGSSKVRPKINGLIRSFCRNTTARKIRKFFRKYIRKSPKILNSLQALRGSTSLRKQAVCWCAALKKIRQETFARSVLVKNEEVTREGGEWETNRFNYDRKAFKKSNNCLTTTCILYWS